MASSAAKENPNNFSFGFNNPQFSDVCLNIKLVPESFQQIEFEGEGGENQIHGVRVKEIHVSRLLLASRSDFFSKLFSNGMNESTESSISILINESEEDSFMDLLRFTYNKTLSASSQNALMDVLMTADQFGFDSCAVYCCKKILSDFEMSLESAIEYLNLNNNKFLSFAAQPIIEAATHFCVSHFPNIKGADKAKVLKLPLFAFEAMIRSDKLRVPDERYIVTLVLDYIRANYSSDKERHYVLSNHLWNAIRFPLLPLVFVGRFLKLEFGLENSLKCEMLLQILLFQFNFSDLGDITKREYDSLAVKVMVFDIPKPNCVVYMQISRQECTSLQSHAVSSQEFWLMGRSFHMTVQCSTSQDNAERFGLFLWMRENSQSCQVDVTFSVRLKPSKAFHSIFKRSNWTLGKEPLGSYDFVELPWADFIGANSRYFIDDCLYLKVDLMSGSHQPVREAAGRLCLPQYRNISQCTSDIFKLTPSEFEGLFRCDDIRVPNEDCVLGLVVTYIARNVSSEEEKQTLVTRLWNVIRYPFLSAYTLRRVLTSESILKLDSDTMYKMMTLVLEAETSTSEMGIAILRQRDYQSIPVRVMVFDSPQSHCHVYWKLTRQKVLELFPSSVVLVQSQEFYFLGRAFSLVGHCGMLTDELRCFGIGVKMREGCETFSPYMSLFMRIRPAEDYERLAGDGSSLVGGIPIVHYTMLPWDDFVSDASHYFIDDNLYITVEFEEPTSPQQH